MKLLVLRSINDAPGSAAGGDYSQAFDTRYSARVLSNLRDEVNFCTACGQDCIGCRASYGRNFAADIAGIGG